MSEVFFFFFFFFWGGGGGRGGGFRCCCGSIKVKNKKNQGRKEMAPGPHPNPHIYAVPRHAFNWDFRGSQSDCLLIRILSCLMSRI